MVIVRILRLIFLLVLTSSYSHCHLQDITESEDCGNAKVDMVMVIDSSGSVQSVFESYRDAAQDLVRMLPIGHDRTLLAIVQYNGQNFLKMEFTDDQTVEIVNNTISELEWLGGTTHSAEAVDAGIGAYLKGRPDASKMFVLMTDGNSYNTWERVMETADRLHNTGARIYIVALGDTMYEPELEAYAGPNGTIIKKSDFNKFKGEILDLTGYVCHVVEHSIDRPVIHLGKPLVSSPVPYPLPPSTTPIPLPPYIPPSNPQSSTVPQTTPPSSQGCPADILFILDSSGKARTDFERQIQFMLDIIDTLSIDKSMHLVSVVEYSGEMQQRVQFSFTAYSTKDALVSAIKALPYFSGTISTGQTLKFGKDALGDRRPSIPSLVIVLTDGFSQDDIAGPATALRAEPNTAVYAVGVTSFVNPKELLNIAGDSTHVYNEANAAKIKTEVLPTYLSCHPPSTAPPQTTTIPTIPPTTTAIVTSTIPPVPTTAALPTTTTSTSISTTTISTSTVAPITTPPTVPTIATIPPTTPEPTNPPITTSLPSTLPPTTPIPATTTEIFSTGCLLDLYFVLDSSGSVAQTFRRELEFSASIVDRLIVGPHNARIGALKYAGSGKARVVFPFDKYSTADQVKNAILATTFVSGTTATNEALELAASEYDSSKGARPGEARFIVVVFTDGFSQDDPGKGAKVLQSKGATIYAIGVNSAHPVNKAELLEIAGDESRVFTDETIDSLYSALDHLEQACKDAVGKEGPAQPKPQPPSSSQTTSLPQPQPQPPYPPQSQPQPQPSSVIYGGSLSLSPPGPPTSPPQARPYPQRLRK